MGDLYLSKSATAEITGDRLTTQLTVVDTPGFGDYVNNKDSWTPIVDFIDDQHESYMRQEQQPLRSDKQDLRIHACIYFIKPTGSLCVLRGLVLTLGSNRWTWRS